MRKFEWIEVRSVNVIVIALLLLNISMGKADVLYEVILFEPHLEGGYATYATSINDSGIIVGSTWIRSVDGWEYKRATVFDYTGNGNDIDLLSERRHSEAHAVSNNGTIVGEAGSQPHITIFDSSGGQNNTDLGEGYAFAVNNNEQVAGRRGTMAFLWDAQDGYRELGGGTA